MLTTDESETTSNPFPSPLEAVQSADRSAGSSDVGRNVLGWSVMGLGVVGLVMPIMPGWILIGWGVILLAPSVPFCARLLDKVEAKVPRLRATIRRFRHRERSC